MQPHFIARVTKKDDIEPLTFEELTLHLRKYILSERIPRSPRTTTSTTNFSVVVVVPPLDRRDPAFKSIPPGSKDKQDK
jgi:hypothetical protein